MTFRIRAPLVLLALAACAAPSTTDPAGTGTSSGGSLTSSWQHASSGVGASSSSSTTGGASSTSGGTAPDGAAIYALRCASCHGGTGQGRASLGPSLRNWPYGRAALVTQIDREMPPANPALCTGACAEAVADFILSTFTDAHPPTDGGTLPADGGVLVDADGGVIGPDLSGLTGQQVFNTYCASCHGTSAQGGTAPRLDRWTRTREEMVNIIDMTMPRGRAGLCDRACSERVGDYILQQLQQEEPEPACTGPGPAPPRALRLLSRREYRATVLALLEPPAAPTCSTHADCNLATESCVSGRCAADPCGTHTFLMPQRSPAPTSVVVAGSFNNWSSTVAAGAYAMEYAASRSTWFAKRALAAGSHPYKFVIDGNTWVADPGNPNTAPDGFGGSNSVVTISCSGTGTPAPAAWDPAARLPPETRPEAFPFDNFAEAGSVTSVHAEEYLAAAEQAAERAALLPHLNTCNAPRTVAQCARDFLGTFGARAFRGPLSTAETDRYASMMSAQASWAAALKLGVTALLASPRFLYRAELGTLQPDDTYLLTPLETAHAMAAFLWNALPDGALRAAAADGTLSTSEGRAAQATRMLMDERAGDVLGTFALQWLGVEKVLGVDKNASLFPSFTSTVRAAMAEETRRFVGRVALSGNGTLRDLLTADWTVLNPALAGFYGVTAPSTEWGVVNLAATPRRGLLGHGSVLATTAHPDQTSPIRRGLFVRRALLCQEFGTPPANAGGVPEVDPTATTRERFRQHTDNAACYACHRYIDDVGFGFEAFDAVGMPRATENGLPVDSAGNMNDVEGFGAMTDAPFSNVAQLGDILADSRAAEACFVRQVTRFATGRLESEEDRCTTERMAERFHAAGQDIRALLVDITRDDHFVRRRP